MKRIFDGGPDGFSLELLLDVLLNDIPDELKDNRSIRHIKDINKARGGVSPLEALAIDISLLAEAVLYCLLNWPSADAMEGKVGLDLGESNRLGLRSKSMMGEESALSSFRLIDEKECPRTKYSIAEAASTFIALCGNRKLRNESRIGKCRRCARILRCASYRPSVNKLSMHETIILRRNSFSVIVKDSFQPIQISLPDVTDRSDLGSTMEELIQITTLFVEMSQKFYLKWIELDMKLQRYVEDGIVSNSGILIRLLSCYYCKINYE